MAKIQSRPKDEDLVLEKLRTVLEEHTGGLITSRPDVPMNTADEVVEAVDMVLGTAVSTCRTLALANQVMAHDLIAVSMRLESVMDLIESMIDVGYDEPLDHAAMDLMDSLISSGIAEPNANGELAFDSRVLMSRGDLKPILREAIQRWVELKIK